MTRLQCLCREQIYASRQSSVWTESTSSGTVWGMAVPSALAVVTMSDGREDEFSSAEQDLFEQLVGPLEESSAIRICSHWKPRPPNYTRLTPSYWLSTTGATICPEGQKRKLRGKLFGW